MAHRIRHAMTQPPLVHKLNGVVEIDETYVGGKARNRRGRGTAQKTPVLSLVERGGRVRSTPVANVTAKNLKAVIRREVAEASHIMTDDLASYRGLATELARHSVVRHTRGEYVRGKAHTNTVEGYFSLLKRGINGTFHHVSRRHLHRYCNECDFRYSTRSVTDGQRTALAVKGAEGKRLMLREPQACQNDNSVL